MRHSQKELQDLLAIMQKLRDPQQGCPWDLKQDFESIIPHTIEETYEVVDAIIHKDWPNLQEELGDLLFQVVFYSQLAKEQGLFEFKDVVQGIHDKLIRRHPHVFAGLQLSEDEIKQQWQKIKAQEKSQKKAQQGNLDGAADNFSSILDDVPKSLPALDTAIKVQQKCAKYGFDWDDVAPVFDKVREEIDEVEAEVLSLQQISSQADDANQKQALQNKQELQNKIEEELGDLLFAVTNLARHLEKDPQVALNKANHKFIRRFQGVEKLASKAGGQLNDFSLEALDGFWEEVKAIEKQSPSNKTKL